MAVHAHGTCDRAKHRRADGTHARTAVLGCIHLLHKLFVHIHLLGVHAMLREILHVDLLVVASPGVEGKKTSLDTFDFKTLEQLPAKMHAGSRSHHRALFLSENRLITLGIFRLGFALDIIGQRRLAQSEECLFEFIVRSIVEEAEGAAAGGGIVDHFGHHRLIGAEIEFVADADLAGGFHKDIPKLIVAVQFPEQEHLDASIRAVFRTVEAGGEDFCVVENHHIAIFKVVDHIFEDLVGDAAVAAVHHHHTALVAVLCGILGDELLGEFELKLG